MYVVLWCAIVVTTGAELENELVSGSGLTWLDVNTSTLSTTTSVGRELATAAPTAHITHPSSTKRVAVLIFLVATMTGLVFVCAYVLYVGHTNDHSDEAEESLLTSVT